MRRESFSAHAGVAGGGPERKGGCGAESARAAPVMDILQTVCVPLRSQLRCVLFDLDGTLLDIDGEQFLDDYVMAFARYFTHWGDVTTFQQVVMAASVPIFQEHPDLTNGEVFRRHLARHLGVSEDVVAREMDRLHRETLPSLPIPRAPIAAARPCVEAALEQGYRVVVATTPIYPLDAIALRLRWAGLDDIPWDLVTHSENMHSCKPDVAYYREVAARVDCAPEQCLMIGDDRLQDMPAAKCGMFVYWTGAKANSEDIWGGPLAHLTRFFQG